VSPLDVKNEVFILLVVAHDPDGFAFADEQAVLDEPSLWGGVDIGPAGEVLAIEEAFPLGEEGRLLFRPGEGRTEEREQGEGGEEDGSVHDLKVAVLIGLW
jgi:hypothetical protein